MSQNNTRYSVKTLYKISSVTHTGRTQTRANVPYPGKCKFIVSPLPQSEAQNDVISLPITFRGVTHEGKPVQAHPTYGSIAMTQVRDMAKVPAGNVNVA
jgi:hypothetical protein